MSLINYCDDRLTDKNTSHSYVEVYEKLFAAKKESATHVLEVGIGSIPYWNGGSIKMWADYFTNAQIHAPDVINIDIVYPDLISHPRIYLHTSNDAYNDKFFENTFLSKNMKFDIVIDDGPHTLESMIKFINTYSKIMKDDGILVVEDLYDMSWSSKLLENTPQELIKYVKVFDRSKVKGRHDDILFVIDKSTKL